jgi:hypothetical protein
MNRQTWIKKATTAQAMMAMVMMDAAGGTLQLDSKWLGQPYE